MAKLRRDGILKRAEDKYHDPGKSFAKRQIADRAARSLVKSLYIEDSTWKEDMQEVEEVIKSIKDVKTDVESNFEFGSKIGLWLDREDCTQEVLLQYPGSYLELYPEPSQTEYLDVLNRSWETVEKRSKEMSK